MFTAHMDMDMDMDSQVKRKQLLYHVWVCHSYVNTCNDTSGSCQPTTLEKETLESVMS